MKIEVIGPGCSRCHETHKVIVNAVAELNLDADIQYITDVMEIAKRGILSTPAVLIDGKLVISGKLPSLGQAKELLKKHQ